jgi:hypothetical protein
MRITLLVAVLLAAALAIDEEVSQAQLAAEAKDKKQEIETFKVVDGR